MNIGKLTQKASLKLSRFSFLTLYYPHELFSFSECCKVCLCCVYSSKNISLAEVVMSDHAYILKMVSLQYQENQHMFEKPTIW